VAPICSPFSECFGYLSDYRRLIRINRSTHACHILFLLQNLARLLPRCHTSFSRREWNIYSRFGFFSYVFRRRPSCVTTEMGGESNRNSMRNSHLIFTPNALRLTFQSRPHFQTSPNHCNPQSSLFSISRPSE